MEGTVQAWWPSGQSTAERTLGFVVLPPVAVVHRTTGLRLTQEVVGISNSRKTIYYVFGDYAEKHHKWVMVQENRTIDYPAPHPRGLVVGTGTEAVVQADGLNITVDCDPVTNNALRIAQLVSAE